MLLMISPEHGSYSSGIFRFTRTETETRRAARRNSNWPYFPPRPLKSMPVPHPYIRYSLASDHATRSGGPHLTSSEAEGLGCRREKCRPSRLGIGKLLSRTGGNSRALFFRAPVSPTGRMTVTLSEIKLPSVLKLRGSARPEGPRGRVAHLS